MISEVVPVDQIIFTRHPFHPFQAYEEDEGASLGPLEDHLFVFPFVVPPGRGKAAKTTPHLVNVWNAAAVRLQSADGSSAFVSAMATRNVRTTIAVATS
jgi:hypothetical protein